MIYERPDLNAASLTANPVPDSYRGRSARKLLPPFHGSSDRESGENWTASYEQAISCDYLVDPRFIVLTSHRGDVSDPRIIMESFTMARIELRWDKASSVDSLEAVSDDQWLVTWAWIVLNRLHSYVHEYWSVFISLTSKILVLHYGRLIKWNYFHNCLFSLIFI